MAANKFHEIFELEVAAISERRKKHKRPAISLEEECRRLDGTPVMRPKAGSNVVGLALSGGGVRSSAFCLGVLQALDYRGLTEKIDYLSTVSGGGYIGTSMTAAMSTGTARQFPFASELTEGETSGVQHIRDHSNYLFPQGLLNIFGNVVVYLRGIFANVVLVLPWLLLLAAFTIWSHPTIDTLRHPNIVGYRVQLPIPLSHFGLALNALFVFIVLLAVWALWRSAPWGHNSDVGLGARFFGIVLVVILVISFFELQPAVLFAITNSSDAAGDLVGRTNSWIKGVAGFLASIGAMIGFLGRFLADALKRSTDKPGFAPFVTRITVRLAMYVAGAAVPLVLWVGYLYLSLWGIQNCEKSCISYAPDWLKSVAAAVPFIDGSISHFYLATGFLMLLISALLSPNANSLHRLYRDRLSKAFLFDPTKRMTASNFFGLKAQTVTSTDPCSRNSDLQPLDSLVLSKLNTDLAPYHLFNAALNIEASKYANRRGRNADFFIFSPLFTGSAATGYVETAQMEKGVAGLTAGTAMAISGAAASSNMGSATIKPLTPTLAILNVRLGYWLTNPAKIAGALKKALIWRLFDKAYFLKELFGLLTEDSETIYLTDGGHIENLGIYELLRRRCKLVIAVDAEADPDMSFRSLVTVERYARIDFGIRIDLPWATLRDTYRDASAEIIKSGGLPYNKSAHGPHCALGTIYYPRKTGDEDEVNSTGVLLYVKSSITGDENDYVIDYKRRNPTFPHETTMDQLFTEEQFEAYRALGFHAVNSAFDLSDKVSMNPETIVWQGNASKIPLETQMRQILL
jgi:hypothetical protein